MHRAAQRTVFTIYDPGILPGSADQCILGKVFLDPIYQGSFSYLGLQLFCHVVCA